MTPTDEIQRIAALDPAADREPTGPELLRAQSTLDAIIDGRFEEKTPASAPRGQRRLRLGLAGTGLAGAAAAVVILAGGGTTGGGGEAQAAWKATPERTTQAQALEQARRCSTTWGGVPGGGVKASDVLLAETRGAGVLTLVKRGGGLVECLTVPGQGTEPPSWTVLDDRGQRAPKPASADRATLVSQGTHGDDGAKKFSDAVGRAGADVTGVSVRTADGTLVHASVAGGWWAAWWPGESAPVKVEVRTKQGASSFAPDALMAG